MRAKPHTFGFNATDDLRRLWANKPMRLALIGILLIPLVYSFIYLSAFYDPYANLNKLPVAVVNEDRGAVQDGEPVHAGADLVDELRKDHTVKWEFVSRERMNQGLANGEYYLGIVIPRQFSAKAVSVSSPEPLKGELEYVHDESNNYLTEKIGDSIQKTLVKNLDEKLTHVYVKAIFDSLANSTRDLAKAADGAGQLAEKTGEAAAGAGRMTDGLRKLQAAAVEMEKGQLRMLAGLNELHQHVAQAKEQINQLPWKKIDEAQSFVHQVNTVIQQLAEQPLPDPGTTTAMLKQNAEQASFSSQKEKQGLEASQAYLDQLVRQHPDLAADRDFAKLKESLAQAGHYQAETSGKLNSVQAKLPEIEKDWSRIVSLRRQIADRSQKMTDQFDREVAKIKQMRSDANRLVDGVNALAAGAGKLADGQNQMLAGVKKLKAGSEQLAGGLEKIGQGQAQLADGLNEGVQKAKNELQGAGKKEEVISDPVRVKETSLHPVPNYATGFAPYFISLSLWVGAMLLFTIVDLYRVLKDKGEPLSLTAGGLIGLGQAAILTSVLMFALDLKPVRPGWFILFALVMSVTFIGINQMLVALLGNVGRFLSIIILMLQLASSGGTYPVELLPSFFKSIHPYLPMTYTVQGLRMALTNGNVQVIVHDLILLLIVLAFSLAVTQIHLRLGKPMMKKAILKLKNA
ncbi:MULTISPECIES: YhgE/Pip family protein [Thermoactinomyces]|uniref:YhgE/Pip domain-containing protein n=1 Tax=Thermoactinomyces daqus TaxID=1329516 RepID=A0A7W1XCM1_9BACL|nr:MULTISPECIES: YhgE/Pip domain-containing protein [Thermoactinomyces]MBA4544204.1 YhgE/Pip domain-containing protein [Thermoactinomyces daqus]MBH8597970.1 YhgE/Pip domain-containing protein [Thermoactinomyces sp. CICC 10523]MBH8604324.1 YhgE/Pip domain-containing protein [Thermoactinomyces sp. CICC 10522]MBH8607779.1 YhgE/Pip domain-containing protein [Thermoactinomyces sp. CICC 10521]